MLVEKRPKGKRVTVISNVRGDGEELLKLLKTRLGSGGVARNGLVEAKVPTLTLILSVWILCRCRASTLLQ